MLAITLTSRTEAVLSSSIRVVLIVVIAVVLNAMGRRAVARLTERMQRAAVEVMDRAPEALAMASRRREARAATVSSVLRSVTTAVVLLVAVLLVMGEIGVNLAPLIAGAGVAGVAFGFGTQSLVRDVVAGLFVLIEDQYGVGDTIDTGQATGVVERVTLRATEVRDVAGTLWHIPNGVIDRVGNQSQGWSRAVVDLVVDPDADVGRVRQVVAGVADALADDPDWSSRIRGRPLDLGVQALDAAGATVRVLIDTGPGEQWAVERELRQRAKAALDEAGVSLAVGAGRSVMMPMAARGGDTGSGPTP